MVYRRRYFPALTITTISYAEKSITAEKLADGAVIHPKVAPDAIDSERVIDGSLKSVDIKDGEIKTVDLSDGSVTTPKIATAAVTPEKLSVSVLTRPISPGVNTAELLDANVTLAKLAPNSVNASKIVAGGVDAAALAGDAVETAKVKDAQITLPKMAPDSIDNTVIKANTIRGTEIATGACGVTELGTDSVQTIKVKDRNITSPKIALNGIIPELIAPLAVTEPKLDTVALARRHIESFRNRQKEFLDEFLGEGLADKWVKTGDAGGRIILASGGLYIDTGAVNGNAQRVDWGGVPCSEKTLIHLPTLNIGVAFDVHTTYITLVAGLWFDANNQIVFFAEDLVDVRPNWKAKCVKGGVSTLVDTGVLIKPATGKIQGLRIWVEGGSSVKFAIDGVEKAHITDPQFIPDVAFEPRLEVKTNTNLGKAFKLNFVSLLYDRIPYA